MIHIFEVQGMPTRAGAQLREVAGCNAERLSQFRHSIALLQPLLRELVAGHPGDHVYFR